MIKFIILALLGGGAYAYYRKFGVPPQVRDTFDTLAEKAGVSEPKASKY
jgi:hypothetical protein